MLLEKELEKKEIKEGLIKACDVIDLIIAILRGSKNLKDAKACLTQGDTSNIRFTDPGFEPYAKKLCFTEKQAQAILEMRLYKLIGLEILALEKEYKETLRKIKEYQKILSGRKYMDQVIKEDLKAIKEEFAVPRRTVLEDGREAVYEEPAVEEVALSILPHLMTTAAKKNRVDKEIVVLTATSGDTGKAAMAGFADVPGTRIIVFYPKDGVE